MKIMNDKLNPEGLVPSVLLFVEYPQAFTNSERRPISTSSDVRSKIAHESRIEIPKHINKARDARALKHSLPAAVDSPCNAGEQILVCRENVVNNRICEWLGPLVVYNYDADKKLDYVHCDKDTASKPFGTVQIKRYFTSEITAYSFLTDVNDRQGILPRANYGKLSYRSINTFRPLARHPRMEEAVNKEVRGLFERDTFKVLLREEVPNSTNVVPVDLLSL